MEWLLSFMPAALSAGVFAAITSEVFYRIHHRPCMKVSFKGNGIYFPSSAEIDKCVAPYRLFFQAIISNESPDPIAITDIGLHFNGIEDELFVNDFLNPAESYDMEPYFYGEIDGKCITKNDSFKIENTIKGGRVIGPYEAMNGVIFIMGCPVINADKLDGILKINTTRKYYEYHVTAFKYHHELQKYID